MNAILAVDIQKGFITNDDYTYILSLCRSFLEDSGSTLKLESNFHNEVDSPLYKNLGWKELMDEESRTSLVKNIVDCSFVRSTYNAALSDVILHLSMNEIDTVYVIGMQTDACVLATVFGLFDAGFTVRVVEELCGTFSQEFQSATIKIMKRQFGVNSVISLDKALQLLNP